MNVAELRVFQDAIEHLSVLSGTFQISCQNLKAQNIRKADKSLVALESAFHHQVAENARQWLRAEKAQRILKERLDEVRVVEHNLNLARSKTGELQSTLSAWNILPAEEQKQILKYASLTKSYLEDRSFTLEAHVLERYRKYESLKALSPYADNAQYLCTAIYHYENRLKYETSLEKLEEKKIDACERLKTVKRGFNLAIILCLFLVTIPICLPFAYTLWGRRREIEKQIADVMEFMRREERRLAAADEGVIAANEIKEVLGNVSLEQIRRTLDEVKELRIEFQNSSQSTNATVPLILFMKDFFDKLHQVFGVIPEDPLESLRWLYTKTEEIKSSEEKFTRIEKEKIDLDSQLKALTKGHSVSILAESLLNIEANMHLLSQVEISDDIRGNFMALCVEIPKVLAGVREGLNFVCNGQTVADDSWESILNALNSCQNVLSVCVLDMEMTLVTEINQDTHAQV